MTKISRRTIAKGAAWSVPVVAVGAAAPAMAASGGFFELNGNGCKLPGASNDTFKGYAFELTATNNTNDPVTVQVDFVTLNGENLGDVAFVDLDTCTALGTNEFTIPADTVLNLALVTENAASSSNGTLAAQYDIVGGPQNETVFAQVDAAPPINGASCDTFTAAEKDCLASFAN
jgi:hypothetical protein